MSNEHCYASMAKCHFPDDAWGEKFIGRESGATPHLPADWRDRIVLAPPPWTATTAECAYLVRALKPLRESKQEEIDQQARGFDIEMIQSIQDVVGSLLAPADRQHARDAMSLVLSHAEPAIFVFKRRFKRGRPFMCCGEEVDPLYKVGDDLYPAHPAYPSGHSTQAHAVAFYYARLFPQLTDDLMERAASIARNREIAGLHYPSDSLAGKQLAQQVVGLMFENAAFRAHTRKVVGEFPEHLPSPEFA